MIDFCSFVMGYFVSGQNDITHEARKVMKKMVFDEEDPELDDYGNVVDNRSLTEILNEDGDDLLQQMDALMTGSL